MLIVDGLFFQRRRFDYKEPLTLMAALRPSRRIVESWCPLSRIHSGAWRAGRAGSSKATERLEVDDVGVFAIFHYRHPVFVDALANMRQYPGRGPSQLVWCVLELAAERSSSIARATVTMRTWARLRVTSAASAAQLRSLRVDNTPMRRCVAPGSSASAPGLSGSAAHRGRGGAMGTAHLVAARGRPRRVFCRRHRLGVLSF